jgi:putative DNA primase/helicase
MADNEMFVPLRGSEPKEQAAAPERDEWRAIIPVPDDAPAAPHWHYRHGGPTRTETYRDGEGRLLGYMLRFDLKGGGKEFAPLTFCEGTGGRREWRWKTWPTPRPLYGLDRLAQHPRAPVLVCEGEKAADAAAQLLPDHVAVTSPNGAKSAAKADWRVLAGRDVTLWPDNDYEGRAYAATLAKVLRGVATSIKVASPPRGAPEKWDAADALAEGWDHAKALALIAAATPLNEPQIAPRCDPESGRQRRRQSASLLDFLPETELWHSPNREAFATIKIAGHFENWPVRSKDFREWLSSRHFAMTSTAPNAQSIEDALRVFEGLAKHQGPEHPLYLRLGEHEGSVFVDLGDPRWRAIEITPQSWRIVDKPPIKFIRPSAMRPLPIPEEGGLIEQELLDLINVRYDSDFVLIIAWLIGCFNPRGPYPILIVNGEQGSAKSTLCRLLRRLIDPNEAEIRLPPHNGDDLIVGARNSHILAFDNMSHIPDWLSDALCSIATGTGFGTREHYSNTNEVIFKGARPILLNGIPNLGDRPDFADRVLHVVLRPIAKENRRSEKEYWREVEARLPLIFGAILDAIARALRDRDTATPPVTRMADFEVWVSAAEPALGWPPGTFRAAYLANREGAVERALEADPLGDAVCQLVESGDWAGPPTELLARLGEKVSDLVRKSPIWPKAPNKLRDRLRRLAPSLRSWGIVLDLETPKAGGNRFIGIRRDRLRPPS